MCVCILGIGIEFESNACLRFIYEMEQIEDGLIDVWPWSIKRHLDFDKARHFFFGCPLMIWWVRTTEKNSLMQKVLYTRILHKIEGKTIYTKK